MNLRPKTIRRIAHRRRWRALELSQRERLLERTRDFVHTAGHPAAVLAGSLAVGVGVLFLPLAARFGAFADEASASDFLSTLWQVEAGTIALTLTLILVAFEAIWRSRFRGAPEVRTRESMTTTPVASAQRAYAISRASYQAGCGLRFPCACDFLALPWVSMAPTKTASPLFARNRERVRRALRELDGGKLLPALGFQLERALEGSDDATREYVRCYHVLTLHVLDEARRARPDLVVRTADGHLALIDVKGTPRRAPVEALETASAEAPFGPWSARFPLEEAVALDLASRVRQLIGLRALDLAPADPGLGEVVDDLAALRFLRRVRFHLNHPDEEHPLRRLMDAFGLSKTELASLFGVRRQAVDQWLERGVPSERQEKVQTLIAICDLLERKLKPGRLAGVSRRAADAYGGETMLELIAADRHRELLELVRDSFDWATAA